jgi:hypothetical protein
MGYSYDWNNRLCCDSCGQSGGVRKRKCTQKVLTDSHRSETRFSINYCYPSALCSTCYQGCKTTLHDGCKEGAAKSQAQYDATQARLEAGEHLLISGRGSWAEDVPEGFVGATFAGNKYADHKDLLVPADLYEQVRIEGLSYEDVQEKLVNA